MNKFYKLVRVEECYAHFETTTPVVLEWKNTSAGINFAVPMGYYKVRINFVWGGIKVLKHKDNIDNARGFWHPYISDQGTVCWGNAADTAADFLHKAQWDMVFDLLHGLLTTYSPDATPYMSLDRFDYYKKLNDKRGSEPAPNCPRCDRQLEINPNTGLTRPCLCFECPSCGDHVEHTAAGRCPNCYCRLCEENRGCEICEDCDNHSGDCSCENET